MTAPGFTPTNATVAVQAQVCQPNAASRIGRASFSARGLSRRDKPSNFSAKGP